MWRHLPWGRMPVWLQYTPWRVSCSRCGVKVERVPWADGSSVFTAAFEESAAYLAQVTCGTRRRSGGSKVGGFGGNGRRIRLVA